MSNFGCINNTIRLRSVRYFDIANPQPDQFTLKDIAGALSKICRFGGHCPRFYSVAEHLVHCAEQAEKDRLPKHTRIAVFAHDFTEAFCGDVVKPLKVLLPRQLKRRLPKNSRLISRQRNRSLSESTTKC